MARFTARVDVWKLSPAERGRLQPGQHISAGGARGVYLGQTRAGSDVAMWEDGAGKDRSAKIKALRGYALSRA